jgi:hypothetical protein
MYNEKCTEKYSVIKRPMYEHIDSIKCKGLCLPVCLLWDEFFAHFFYNKDMAMDTPYCRYIVAYLARLSENCIRKLVAQHGRYDLIAKSEKIKKPISTLDQHTVGAAHKRLVERHCGDR